MITKLSDQTLKVISEKLTLRIKTFLQLGFGHRMKYYKNKFTNFILILLNATEAKRNTYFP